MIPVEIDGKAVTQIGDRAFENCTSLITVGIPDGVTVIGSSAFSHSRSLEEIVIPESVTEIGGSAFFECFALSKVNLPRVLVIDCIKRTMPVWVEVAKLKSYFECTESELSEVTGIHPVDVDNLDSSRRKVICERYTMIASILPYISDDKIRSQLICSAATKHKLSKQAVRNYLCLYLSYMNKTVLAPKCKEDDRGLTHDEKNMRWALNKFFYTTKKQSLMTAYTMMLKEKYCNTLGVLADEYPSFYQFPYNTAS